MVNRLAWAAAFFLTADLSAVELILVDERSDAQALVPSVDNGGSLLGESWKNVTDPANIADWQAGLTGIGYDTSNGDRYRPLIGIDVEQMRTEVGSVFILVPFRVEAPDHHRVAWVVLQVQRNPSEGRDRTERTRAQRVGRAPVRHVLRVLVLQ